MRLYLTVDELRLQKQEMCQVDTNSLEDDDDMPSENEVSLVTQIYSYKGSTRTRGLWRTNNQDPLSFSLNRFSALQIRIVKIVRDEKTGLGLSIKGGAEHNLPIMISQIFKDQAADKTGKLFVGDAIIKGISPYPPS